MFNSRIKYKLLDLVSRTLTQHTISQPSVSHFPVSMLTSVVLSFRALQLLLSCLPLSTVIWRKWSQPFPASTDPHHFPLLSLCLPPVRWPLSSSLTQAQCPLKLARLSNFKDLCDQMIQNHLLMSRYVPSIPSSEPLCCGGWKWLRLLIPAQRKPSLLTSSF